MTALCDAVNEYGNTINTIAMNFYDFKTVSCWQVNDLLSQSYHIVKPSIRQQVQIQLVQFW